MLALSITPWTMKLPHLNWTRGGACFCAVCVRRRTDELLDRSRLLGHGNGCGRAFVRGVEVSDRR